MARADSVIQEPTWHLGSRSGRILSPVALPVPPLHPRNENKSEKNSFILHNVYYRNGENPYMPLFKTRSAAVYGIDAHPVDVEVDLYRSGMARDFMLVGMPDTAVRESRERIKSALMNSGFGYPSQAVTVNLAPAHVRKEGSGFDLPMALAILGAMGTFKGLDQHLAVGELSLDGAIRPVRGALPMAVCARDNGNSESDSADGECGGSGVVRAYGSSACGIWRKWSR